MKGSETMETRLTLVTPAMAREWLDRNTDNRPLRPGVVDGFLSAYRRGEWKITHQGIAFAKSGRLLDGQHRLTFISELPDKTVVPMNVSVDLDEDTFDSIDQGVKRTTSDLYRVSGGLVAVARFICKIAVTERGSAITPQFVKPFIDWVEPEYELLTTFCPTSARMWSSAGVRAAAIINIKLGHDKDFVRLAYDSLVHSNISAMPPNVRVLAQQQMSGKIVSVRGLDLFCRAQRAFNSKDGEVSKILIKDLSGQIAMNREFILRDMKKRAASAGQAPTKSAQKFDWKKVA